MALPAAFDVSSASRSMSRSKHTDPPRIRAARRVRAPFAPRGEGDRSTQWALAAWLKEAGLVPEAQAARPAPERPAPLPRVRVCRPREGHVHPASRADVERVLRFLGAQGTYGLRAVELVRGSAPAAGGRLRLGALSVPGVVRLYDQLPPPWVLPGQVPPALAARMRRAGAIVERVGQGSQTRIVWPGETLRDFMLFDVLIHEIGHHLIQQYKGKRPARVARTRDHETFAERFAYRCRLAYGGEDMSLADATADERR
jgi:hypothetical protein